MFSRAPAAGSQGVHRSPFVPRLVVALKLVTWEKQQSVSSLGVASDDALSPKNFPGEVTHLRMRG